METMFNMFRLGILLLIIILPNIIKAQEKDSINEYQKVFDEFKGTINKEFNGFKTKNDSLFYTFLKQSWKEFKLFQDERPQIPKPQDQPILKIKIKDNKSILPIKRKNILQDSGRQLILNGEPAKLQTRSFVEIKEMPTTTFDFYGNMIEIPSQTEIKSKPTYISNDEIASFFKYACENDKLKLTINLLEDKAIDYNLNGWGYIELVRASAMQLYKETNEQVLLSWYSLLKSGYDVRIGYSKTDVYLLAAFDTPVYYIPYYKIDNKKYYLVLFEAQNSSLELINSYEYEYSTDLTLVNLHFKNLPVLKVDPTSKTLWYKNKEVKFDYDANLINYYNTYPECDLSVYFTPPLSPLAIASIDRVLTPYMENKSTIEKIDVLLDFVQHSIGYKTDEEQFGKENYMFAEEAIYFPFADCEDRSVLLSQLIKHFIGVKTIALIYPKHVSLGVKISEPIDGFFVNYNNEKYYVADPTYIGAKTGMIMSQYVDVSPEIIEF